jgi:hypothetical protein
MSLTWQVGAKERLLSWLDHAPEQPVQMTPPRKRRRRLNPYPWGSKQWAREHYSETRRSELKD